jgi:hypothetical protein
LAKRLAGRPDRVQRVALGAAAAGWPLGSTHLEDLLAVLLQEPGKAGAEAARPSTAQQRRPDNCAWAKSSSRRSPAASALVVIWASTPPKRVTAAAVRVSRWVSTPMTPSTCSASMGIAVVLLVWGRPWSVSAWEESPRGRTVMGHNQAGWTGC